MIPIQFRPAAEQDVLEAVDWYESQLPGLGARFFADFEHAVARISKSREQFPVVYRGARRALLLRFPFGVFFKDIEDRSLVVAVADLRREPGRWQRRV